MYILNNMNYYSIITKIILLKLLAWNSNKSHRIERQLETHWYHLLHNRIPMSAACRRFTLQNHPETKFKFYCEL